MDAILNTSLMSQARAFVAASQGVVKFVTR
jgi:hypothetical protein